MSNLLSIQALLVAIVLILYILTSYQIQKRNVFLQVAIIFGLVIALSTKQVFFLMQVFGEEIQFDEQVFFSLLLPPIIFSATFNLPKKFFSQLAPILFFGVVSTILTYELMTIFTSFLPNYLSQADYNILSSILVSTDTLAAISIIKPSIYPVLNAILFGEGIVNDAIAIIIYRIQHQYSILLFFAIILGSVFIGLIIGSLTSYFFKYQSLQHPTKELCLIFLSNYLAYLIAELLELSGILCIFVSGVMTKQYVLPNLQNSSSIHETFESIGYMAEAFVFTYLGYSVFWIKASSVDWNLVISIFLLVCLARAISLFIWNVLRWLLRRQGGIGLREVAMIWYGGIIKGAVAFGMCLHVESLEREKIVATTTIIVFASVIILSGFMQIFAKMIGIYKSEKENELLQDTKQAGFELSNINIERKRSLNSEYQRQQEEFMEYQQIKKLKFFQRLLRKIDKFYLKPLFSKNTQNSNISMQ